MATPRVGAAVAGAAIVLVCSGVAAAAAVVITDDPTGAPTPTASPGDDGRGQGHGKGRSGGVGPDAAGPAHHGLCTAWSHVKDAPGHAAQSPAFRNLQKVGCEDGAATRGKGKDKEKPEKSKDEAGTAGSGRPDNPGKGHAKNHTPDDDSTTDGDDSGEGTAD